MGQFKNFTSLFFPPVNHVFWSVFLFVCTQIFLLVYKYTFIIKEISHFHSLKSTILLCVNKM